MEAFCKHLPKIELHAHLNGSLSAKTLMKLGGREETVLKYQSPETIPLEDCFPLFRAAHDLTQTKENVYLATQSVIEEFYDENVVYLELRTTPRSSEKMTTKEYVQAAIDAIIDNKHKEKIKVKLLLSIDRRHSLELSQENMSLIIEMKSLHPDIICGVDLSGDPHEGKFDAALFQKARENGLFVSLHCAEIRNEAETKEMLLFKPDRLGHCTCIHPNYGGTGDLWNRYCDLKIPAEMCLSSNVSCRTAENYDKHHLSEWLRNKLPFVICTDDKGVFMTNLSREYYLAAKHHNLDKNKLYETAYNAIDHIFGTAEEKELLKSKMCKWKDAK